MSRSLVVLGTGPGVGQALARRYGGEDHRVVLVARRQEWLDRLRAELEDEGVEAYSLAADLADVAAVPPLADRIRDLVGEPDVVYWGAAADAFVPVLDLTVERVHELLPLGIASLVEVVRSFVPSMLDRRDGAVLSAQGASALHGNPRISGGLVLAGQRNYLQALHAEVAERGVYVGALYIGAAIEHTPFHAWMQDAKAAGEPVPDIPVVDPARLADLLWEMEHERTEAEATFAVADRQVA